MGVTYLSLSWEEYHTLAQKLAAEILSQKQKYDEIVAIARGGLTLGHLLSDFLRIPISAITIQSYTDIQKQGEVKITAGLKASIKGKHILIVDDISDTGKTLKRAVSYLHRFRPASMTMVTLFFKPHSLVRPDFFAKVTDQWVLLPYEVTEWVHTFTRDMMKEGTSKADIQIFLESLGYTPEQIEFVREHHL